MFKDLGWGLKRATCLAPFLDTSHPQILSMNTISGSTDELFLISMVAFDCKLPEVKGSMGAVLLNSMTFGNSP